MTDTGNSGDGSFGDNLATKQAEPDNRHDAEKRTALIVSMNI